MKLSTITAAWKGPALAALALFVLAGAPARAEDGMTDSYQVSHETEQGNQLYHQGKYDQARAGYMRAKDRTDEQSGEAYRLHYNIGNTFYKEGSYDEAEKEFTQAAASTDPKLQEQAYYNLGNVYVKKGQQAKDIKLLQKAVEHYQKALEINPDNQDAKYNIEVVRRMIQLQQKQQPPQSQSQPDSKDRKDQEQKKPDQQNQQNQQNKTDQNQQQPDQPDKDQQGQDQQGKDKQKDQQKKPEEQKPQTAAEPKPQDGGTGEPSPSGLGGNSVDQKGARPPQSQQPEGSAKAPNQLSKEEADMLLKAVEQREQEDMKRVMDARSPDRPTKEKDW